VAKKLVAQTAQTILQVSSGRSTHVRGKTEHGLPRSMGLLGVARANTAVGVSPEIFLPLLHDEEGVVNQVLLSLSPNYTCTKSAKVKAKHCEHP
jgi:hypothetical protein